MTLQAHRVSEKKPEREKRDYELRDIATQPTKMPIKKDGNRHAALNLLQQFDESRFMVQVGLWPTRKSDKNLKKQGGKQRINAPWPGRGNPTKKKST